MVSYCCFNLYFSDNIDVKHLFECLFATCIFSLVMCLLKILAYFLFFLLFSFKCFLYILDNCFLSDVSFANSFSWSVAYLIFL